MIVQKNVLAADGTTTVLDNTQFTVAINNATTTLSSAFSEGSSATFLNLPTGIYTITEASSTNYSLVSISSSTVEIGTGTTTVTIVNKQVATSTATTTTATTTPPASNSNGSSGGGGYYRSAGSSGSTVSSTAPSTGLSGNDLVTLLGILANSDAPVMVVPVYNQPVKTVTTVTTVTNDTPVTADALATTTQDSGVTASTSDQLPLAAAVATANGVNLNWWWLVGVVVLGGVLYLIFRKKE